MQRVAGWGGWRAVPWVLCAQFFVAEAITARAVRTGYSFRWNVISDLGAVRCGGALCSPLHGWMDASFALQGVLIVSGALLLRRSLPRSAWTHVAVVLLVISGVGLVGVGVAPEDVRPAVHFVAAAVHFVAGDAAMACVGVALLRGRRSGVAGVLSCVAGVFTLLCTALLASRAVLVTGAGATERASVYPYVAWLVAMGAWFAVRGWRGAGGEMGGGEMIGVRQPVR